MNSICMELRDLVIVPLRSGLFFFSPVFPRWVLIPPFGKESLCHCTGWLSCQLDTSKGYWEEKHLNWGTTSIGLSCRQVCRTFSWLIINMRGSSFLGRPGQVILDVRNQAKKTMSKPVRDILPWLLLYFCIWVPAMVLLWWWIITWKCKMKQTLSSLKFFKSLHLLQQWKS